MAGSGTGGGFVGREAELDRLGRRLEQAAEGEGGLVVIRGPVIHRRNAGGTAARSLTPDEMLAALRDEIGISEALINQWVECGALDATFIPWSGPPPAPFGSVRPSRRAR